MRESAAGRRRNLGRGRTLAEPEHLKRHREGIEVTAEARTGAGVVRELQRLSPPDRQREGRAEPGVPLEVRSPNAIEVHAAARVPSAVEGQPHARAKGVAQVSLESLDGLLALVTLARI